MIEDKIHRLDEIRKDIMRTSNSRNKSSKKKSERETSSKKVGLKVKVHDASSTPSNLKRKVFRNIEARLFESRVDNFELNNYLTKNKKKHADIFNYDYMSDKNLTNLKYSIYLLIEEMNHTVDTLHSSKQSNINEKSVNDLEEKIQKRNKIIDYLLKEKISTANVFTKVIGCFENTALLVSEVHRVVLGMPLSSRNGWC